VITVETVLSVSTVRPVDPAGGLSITVLTVVEAALSDHSAERTLSVRDDSNVLTQPSRSCSPTEAESERSAPT
jgi:hypothetical protein